MTPAREPVLEADSDSHSSRTIFAPTHITPEIFLGDKMPDDKPPNSTRTFFVNVNDLRFGRRIFGSLRPDAFGVY
jgi:hypothetical protein